MTASAIALSLTEGVDEQLPGVAEEGRHVVGLLPAARALLPDGRVLPPDPGFFVLGLQVKRDILT